MRRLFLATLGLLAGAGMNVAQAATHISAPISDPAAFLAAIPLSYSGRITQDFSGIAAANSSLDVTGQTIGGITFGLSGESVSVADAGSNAARFDWGTGAVLAMSTSNGYVTLTFAPAMAFGAWFGTAEDYEDMVIFTALGEENAVFTGAYPTLTFIGFISDTPFTSVTFATGGSAYAIMDDIIIAVAAVAIPEPISVALFGAALLGLGVARRRRV